MTQGSEKAMRGRSLATRTVIRQSWKWVVPLAGRMVLSHTTETQNKERIAKVDTRKPQHI